MRGEGSSLFVYTKKGYQGSLCKIQGLPKESPWFSRTKVHDKYRFTHKKSTSEMLDQDNGEISIKLLCLYLVQYMLCQIKAQQFYTDLGLYLQC